MKSPEGKRYYFVDEAGDPTLFNSRGTVIVGKAGVSRTFLVGVALLPDPPGAGRVLDELRKAILVDPYFRNVPSLQPDQNKTAICFHAKNDLPEVRREVFRILPSFGASVQVAIRRKDQLARLANLDYQRGNRLSANDIYDDLVKRLFRTSSTRENPMKSASLVEARVIDNRHF